jgi:hypothetical protein
MSNFIFFRHVLTGAAKLPFALSYFSCVHAHPMFVVLLPPSTLVSFAPFLSYCVREGSLLSGPVPLVTHSAGRAK